MATFDSCQQIRRFIVRTGALNTATGQLERGAEKWVTDKCNTPLFGDRKLKGICRSCDEGWRSPDNFPVDGIALVNAAPLTNGD